MLGCFCYPNTVRLTEREVMPRSDSKVVLFSRVTVDKHIKQHPVAVFANDKLAKSHAALIASAVSSGNTVLAKQLDASVALDADGNLIAGVKFSVLTIPYNPTMAAASDDLFAEDTSPAK